MTLDQQPGGAEAERAPVLDSHVHFWDPQHLSYPWLADVPPLDRRFSPSGFPGDVDEPVEAVFVEAGRHPDQAAQEVRWVRSLARTQPWIRGAVAHVSLDDPAGAPDGIRRFAADPFVVGVRHNIQDEEPGFTEGADFRAGVGLLGRAGLPFDACVREQQLGELAELAAACPQTLIDAHQRGPHLPAGGPHLPAAGPAAGTHVRRGRPARTSRGIRMRRLAQTIRLRPERRAEYLELHRSVWPGVEAALRAANIRNYTIFLRDDVLFSYFEHHGADFEADLASITADPDTQRWWRFTDPCQEPWPDSGAGGNWSDLEEIWHLSEESPA